MSRVQKVPVSSDWSSSLRWLLGQILQNCPAPEATEKSAEQAAGRLNSTAGFFFPKALAETDHLMNVGLYLPYRMQLWMCL